MPDSNPITAFVKDDCVPQRCESVCPRNRYALCEYYLYDPLEGMHPTTHHFGRDRNGKWWTWPMVES